MERYPKREEARAFLARHLVWDNHACMPLRWNDEAFLPQLQRYRDAGVDVVSLNIGFGEQSVEQHFRVLGAFRRWIGERPRDFVLVQTPADVNKARAEGKLGITFDIEGARAIDDQPSLVQAYYDLGVRWMLMAYNRRNLVGDGVYDDEEAGLTAFGAEVVAEMERVGMVVCCSHTGPRTARDVMERATRPVIFSHSNANAVWPHRRNIEDELMRACAATGGVVGINGVGKFLGENDASSEAFVRHLEHAVETIGPDHVGIGLDYVFDMAEIEEYFRTMRHTFPDDGELREPPKFVAPEQLVEIVALLLEHGYGGEDLAKILGGNHLRIANQVWKAPAPV